MPAKSPAGPAGPAAPPSPVKRFGGGANKVNGAGAPSRVPAPGVSSSGNFSKMSAVQLRKFKDQASKIQKCIRMFLAKRRAQKQLAALRAEKERAASALAAKKRAEQQAAQKEKSTAAAVKIQTVARAMICRRRYKRDKEKMKKMRALGAKVIPLQAVARRWLVLRGLDLHRLEKQVRDLEAQKAGQSRIKAEGVAAVEDWKMEEMKKIHEKYAKKKAKLTGTPIEELDTTFIESSQLAHKLRQENKDFRVEIETLKTDCKGLMKNNLVLERTVAQVEKNLEILRGALPKLEADNKKLLEVNEAYQKKKEQYEHLFTELQEKIDLDASLKSLYLLTAQEIVTMASKSRREPDPRLIPMIKQAAERDFKKTDMAYKATLKKIAAGPQGESSSAAPGKKGDDDDDDDDEDDDEEKPARGQKSLKPKRAPKSKSASKTEKKDFNMTAISEGDDDEDDEDDDDDDEDHAKGKKKSKKAASESGDEEEEDKKKKVKKVKKVKKDGAAEEKKKKKEVAAADGAEEADAVAEKKEKKKSKDKAAAEGGAEKKKKKKKTKGSASDDEEVE